MILVFLVVLALCLVPYPRRLRQWAVYLCLAFALLLAAAASNIVVTYRGDGLFLGSVCLLLMMGFLFRAYWTRRSLQIL